MIRTTDDSLELTLTIAARPETVFEMFTDPAAFGEWMGAAHGVATIDPVVGGALRVEFPGASKIVTGEVTAVDAPHRFAFTWGYEDGVPFAPGTTEVTVTLTPVAGGTQLTLVHAGLPSETAARDHAGGWRLYGSVLSGLACRRAYGTAAEEAVHNWFAAWNETDAARRATLLEAATAEDVRFLHPYAALDARDDLSGHIAQSQAMMGELQLRGSGTELCHDYVRFGWEAVMPDGTVAATGANVGRMTLDGRLAHVIGFTDSRD